MRMLAPDPFALAECPCWQPDEQALYWTDIPARKLHRYDFRTTEHSECALPSEAGLCVPAAPGKILTGLSDGLYLVDFATGASDLLVKMDFAEPGRFNDGKCDAHGRLFAGTMSLASPPEPTGKLFSYEDGKFSTLESGLKISNGMGWSPDHSLFYLSDTEENTIWLYDYDGLTGAIGNRRRFDLDPLAGKPDGLCVDSLGRVYSARWGGGCIAVLGADGHLLETIRLPVPNVTSCCFGGPDLKTLFVTTAKSAETHSGRIFRIERKIPGMEARCA